MLQGRLDAAVEQRIAEGVAAARDLSAARAELDAARAAASEADAAVAELRGGLDAARAREQEQQRLLSELQVRHCAVGSIVRNLALPDHAYSALRIPMVLISACEKPRMCLNLEGVRMFCWMITQNL